MSKKFSNCLNCDGMIAARTKYCSRKCQSEYELLHFIRKCKTCGKTSKETEFGPQAKTRDGLRTICKSCTNDKAKSLYDQLSIEEKHLLKKKKYASVKSKNRIMLLRYGITFNEYNGLLQKQNNACFICKNKFEENNPANIDHNHSTGVARGLLCKSCNWGLGLFNESVCKFNSAIFYLNTSPPDTSLFLQIGESL